MFPLKGLYSPFKSPCVPSIPGRFLPLLEVSLIASTHAAQVADAAHAQNNSETLPVSETGVTEGAELLHLNSGPT